MAEQELLPGVKFIPLRSQWTCPKCQSNNVISAAQMDAKKVQCTTCAQWVKPDGPRRIIPSCGNPHCPTCFPRSTRRGVERCLEIAVKYQDSQMFNRAATMQAEFIEKEIRALLTTEQVQGADGDYAFLRLEAENMALTLEALGYPERGLCTPLSRYRQRFPKTALPAPPVPVTADA